MPCPSCGGGTPREAKFCPHCGVPQPRRCPGCATPLPAASRFCIECGLRVSTSPDTTSLQPPSAADAPSSQPPDEGSVPSESLSLLGSGRSLLTFPDSQRRQI